MTTEKGPRAPAPAPAAQRVVSFPLRPQQQQNQLLQPVAISRLPTCGTARTGTRMERGRPAQAPCPPAPPPAATPRGGREGMRAAPAAEKPRSSRGGRRHAPRDNFPSVKRAGAPAAGRNSGAELLAPTDGRASAPDAAARTRSAGPRRRAGCLSVRGLRSGGRRGSRERRGGDARTVFPPRLTEPPPRSEGARSPGGGARAAPPGGGGGGGAGPARAEAGRGPRRGRVRPVPEGALFPRAASRAPPALGGHVSPRLARRAVLRKGLLLPRARVRGLTDSRRSADPRGGPVPVGRRRTKRADGRSVVCA